MQRHGQAVRSLDLGLEVYVELSAVVQNEMVSLLDGCVSVCAGSLECLELHLSDFNHMLGSWVAAAHRLEDLRLSGLACMTAWATLEHMASLQRLDLWAGEWQLGTAVALPASLTRLSIDLHQAEEMPAQVRVRAARSSV